MLQYIYFVKCPGCEDEHFDFFEEAKELAMQYIKQNQKPIITQIEVDRNDFGECVNSCDLGTVWSWEEVMGKETTAEPAKSIFTKDDLKCLTNKEDPEFANIDNSVDFEIEEVSEPTIERKPVPKGMSIDQLKEAMEENEDTVECAGCEELFPKDECWHKEGIGWLCGDCEDRIVKCTWCEELYDRSKCRYEVDLGWLCDRCEAGIKSRGETLTFREGNYWDFLDEDLNQEMSLEDLVKDSINHLVNDLGKDPWAEDFAYNVLSDIEDNYDVELPFGMNEYRAWASSVQCEVSRQVNRDYSINEEIVPEEVHDLGNTYDGGYPSITSAELEEIANDVLAPAEDTLQEAADNSFKGYVEVLLDDTIEVSYDDLKLPDGEPFIYNMSSDIDGDFVTTYVTDKDVADLSVNTNIKPFATVAEIENYTMSQYRDKSRGLKDLDEWTKFINGNFVELVYRHADELARDVALRTAVEDCYNETVSDDDFDDLGPGGGAFASWDDFWRWKEG